VAGIEFSSETIKTVKTQLCFPGGSVVNNLLANAEDARMHVRSLVCSLFCAGSFF